MTLGIRSHAFAACVGALAVIAAAVAAAPIRAQARYSVLGTTQVTTADLMLSLIANSSAIGAPATSPASTLENTNWKLTKLGSQAMPAQSSPREIHILLQSEQKRVTGSGGCNQFTGSYTLAGERLGFSKVAATMMACIQGMDIEQTFLKVLHNTASWRILNQSLELFDSAGKSLAQFESVSRK